MSSNTSSDASLAAQRLAAFGGRTQQQSQPHANPSPSTVAGSTNVSSLPVAPTRVRRNSAPKGAVTSLLSFWREREKGTAKTPTEKLVVERQLAQQDNRIERERRSIILMKEARAAHVASVANIPSQIGTSVTTNKTNILPSTSTAIPSQVVHEFQPGGSNLPSHLLKVPFFSPPALTPSTSVATTMSPYSDRDLSDGRCVSAVSPSPTVLPAAAIELASTTEPAANIEHSLSSSSRLQSEPAPLATRDDCTPQAAPLFPLPLLTRTVTDVGYEIGEEEEESASEQPSTVLPPSMDEQALGASTTGRESFSLHSTSFQEDINFDGVPLDATNMSSSLMGTATSHLRGHRGSQFSNTSLSTLSSTSSVDTNSALNLDGVPWDSPAHHQSRLAHRRHEQNTSNLSFGSDAPMFAPAPSTGSNTTGVVDHLVYRSPSLAAQQQQQQQHHPQVRLSQPMPHQASSAPPLTREITDHAATSARELQQRQSARSQTDTSALQTMNSLTQSSGGLQREVTDMLVNVGTPPDSAGFAVHPSQSYHQQPLAVQHQQQPGTFLPLQRETTDLALVRQGQITPASASPEQPTQATSLGRTQPPQPLQPSFELKREVTDLLMQKGDVVPPFSGQPTIIATAATTVEHRNSLNQSFGLKREITDFVAHKSKEPSPPVELASTQSQHQSSLPGLQRGTTDFGPVISPPISQHTGVQPRTSVAAASPPPLQREVTDLGERQQYASITPAIIAPAVPASTQQIWPLLTREVTDLGGSFVTTVEGPTAAQQTASVSMLPPLQREVTDLGGMDQSDDTEVLRPNSVSREFMSPPVVTASAPPLLRREITDLGLESMSASIREDEDMSQVNQEVVAAGALPLLTREVTDLGGQTGGDDFPIEGDARQVAGATLSSSPNQLSASGLSIPGLAHGTTGELLPAASELECIRSDVSVPNTPSVPMETAVRVSHASLFPVASYASNNSSSVVSGGSLSVPLQSASVSPVPPPMTRLATDPHNWVDGCTQSSPPEQDRRQQPIQQQKPLERIQTDVNMVALAARAEESSQNQQHPAPSQQKFLERVQTDMNLVGKVPESQDEEDLPPTEPVTPDGQTVGLQQPLLARVQTELNLAAAEADATIDNRAPIQPTHRDSLVRTAVPATVSAAPLLTRVQTELELSGLDQASDETKLEPRRSSIPASVTATPFTMSSIAPPPLSRLKTEQEDLSPESQNESDEDSPDPRAQYNRPSISHQHQQQPSQQQRGSLSQPLLQRVQTELDLAQPEDGTGEDDADVNLLSSADTTQQVGLAQPSLMRLVTDPLLTSTAQNVASPRSAASVFGEEGDEFGDSANSSEAGDRVEETLPRAVRSSIIGTSAHAPRVSITSDDGEASIVVGGGSDESTTPSSSSINDPGSNLRAYSFSRPPDSPTSLTAALTSPPPVPPSPSVSATPSTESATGCTSAATGTTTASHEEDSHRHLRQKVTAELLSSEETYVSNLGLLVREFIHPLKTSCDSLGVTPSQVSIMFGSVELLFGFHMIFLQDLKKAIKQSQAAEVKRLNKEMGVVVPQDETPDKTDEKSTTTTSSKVQTVSEIFNSMSPFLRMYSQYLAGYPLALDTIAGLRGNMKFQQFLLDRRSNSSTAASGAPPPSARASIAQSNQSSSSQGLDLMSYLILPVQRIPRYLLLLKEILRFTPKNHPELEGLRDAYTKVQSVALHINEQQRHVENMSILLSIQNSISSGSGGQAEFGQLMQPHRRLVRSGLLQKLTSGLISTSHPRKVYLFNDCLIWVEPSAASSSTATSGPPMGEKFRGHIDLANVGVREYFERGSRTGFRLSQNASTRSAAGATGGVTPTGSSGKKSKDIIFLCSSSSEKLAWLTDIRAASTTAQELQNESRRRRLDSRVQKAAAQTRTIKAVQERRASLVKGAAGTGYSVATLPSPKSSSTAVTPATFDRVSSLPLSPKGSDTTIPSNVTGLAMHGFVGAALKDLVQQHAPTSRRTASMQISSVGGTGMPTGPILSPTVPEIRSTATPPRAGSVMVRSSGSSSGDASASPESPLASALRETARLKAARMAARESRERAAAASGGGNEIPEEDEPSPSNGESVDPVDSESSVQSTGPATLLASLTASPSSRASKLFPGGFGPVVFSTPTYSPLSSTLEGEPAEVEDMSHEALDELTKIQRGSDPLVAEMTEEEWAEIEELAAATHARHRRVRASSF